MGLTSYELRVKDPALPSPLYIFVKDPALPLKFVIPTFISVRVQKIFSHTQVKLPAFVRAVGLTYNIRAVGLTSSP